MKDLFKKETNISLFSGLRVRLSTGEEGRLEGGFGQSGKVSRTSSSTPSYHSFTSSFTLPGEGAGDGGAG